MTVPLIRKYRSRDNCFISVFSPILLPSFSGPHPQLMDGCPPSLEIETLPGRMERGGCRYSFSTGSAAMLGADSARTGSEHVPLAAHGVMEEGEDGICRLGPPSLLKLSPEPSHLSQNEYHLGQSELFPSLAACVALLQGNQPCRNILNHPQPFTWVF